MIPGLGTSVRPPLLDESFIDDVVRVEEVDTIRACHRLAGAGSCSAARAARSSAARCAGWPSTTARELTAVAIAPDLGERYLDTVYQTNWLHDLYGEDVLGPDGG